MRITENSTPEEPEAPNPDTVGKFDIYHALSYTTDDIAGFIDIDVSRATSVRKNIICLIVKMRGEPVASLSTENRRPGRKTPAGWPFLRWGSLVFYVSFARQGL